MTVLSGECAARLPEREVELRKLSAADLAGCAAAYERKPTRFVRPEEDWTSLLESDSATGRGVDVTALCEGGTCVGYLVPATTNEDGIHRIDEFAGEPGVLAGALAQLMAQRGCHGLEMRLQAGDMELRGLLEAAGASFRTVATGGTLLLLRFAQVMERLRPHFEARMGVARAAAACGSRRTANSSRLAPATTPSPSIGPARPRPFSGIPRRSLCRACGARYCPSPTLWYGLNYT